MVGGVTSFGGSREWIRSSVVKDQRSLTLGLLVNREERRPKSNQSYVGVFESNCTRNRSRKGLFPSKRRES